jgi:hypothetical protein
VLGRAPRFLATDQVPWTTSAVAKRCQLQQASARHPAAPHCPYFSAERVPTMSVPRQ